MRNIAIYTKGEKYLTDEELEQWSVLIKKYDLVCSINSSDNLSFCSKALKYGFTIYNDVEELPQSLSLVVSYGGDGTFLHSIDKFKERNLPILGINSGRLGFLASVPRGEIEVALVAVLAGEYEIEQRPLIEITSEGNRWYAFNEFTLQKSALSMISVRLSVDGEYVADYMGDGLIISTPSGSTAYSMSVGGAIMAPTCSCFMVNPIAPHNLNMRPIIINDTSVLELSADSRDDKALATMDNRFLDAANGKKFRVVKSRYNVKLLKLKNSSFYKTIREKLMWGFDVRQLGNY